MRNSALLFCVCSLVAACATPPDIKTADRPELREEKEFVYASQLLTERDRQLSDKDLSKYAYELGYDPVKGLSEEERNAVLNRRKVRELERSIELQKEKAQYSKILPFLQSDEEKIQFLSIPSVEGRQHWVNRKKIWDRVKADSHYHEALETQDIAVGMTADLVRKSWGDPQSIEASGNSVYKNERWKYTRDVPSPSGYKRERRFVYFEGGRVIGWETE